MTTDTGVPLMLKYDYQETQTVWKTRMDTQDQLWSKNRTSLHQSIVESLPVCKEAQTQIQCVVFLNILI